MFRATDGVFTPITALLGIGSLFGSNGLSTVDALSFAARQQLIHVSRMDGFRISVDLKFQAEAVLEPIQSAGIDLRGWKTVSLHRSGNLVLEPIGVLKQDMFIEDAILRPCLRHFLDCSHPRAERVLGKIQALVCQMYRLSIDDCSDFPQIIGVDPDLDLLLPALEAGCKRLLVTERNAQNPHPFLRQHTIDAEASRVASYTRRCRMHDPIPLLMLPRIHGALVHQPCMFFEGIVVDDEARD